MEQAHRDPGCGKVWGVPMDLGLNLDSGTSWLCHLGPVTSPL